MVCSVLAVLCLVPWQPRVAALEIAADALIITDGLQTSRLVAEGFTERESDAVIGHYPKPRNALLYFGALTLGHILMTNALEKISPKLAYAFEGLTIGWEGYTVALNFSAGVRL